MRDIYSKAFIVTVHLQRFDKVDEIIEAAEAFLTMDLLIELSLIDSKGVADMSPNRNTGLKEGLPDGSLSWLY